MSVRVEAVLAARAVVYTAELRLYSLIRQAYPTGSTVSWEHGEYTRSGSVTDHSDDRIKVRSATGAEFWIYATRITDVRVP